MNSMKLMSVNVMSLVLRAYRAAHLAVMGRAHAAHLSAMDRAHAQSVAESERMRAKYAPANPVSRVLTWPVAVARASRTQREQEARRREQGMEAWRREQEAARQWAGRERMSFLEAKAEFLEEQANSEWYIKQIRQGWRLW